MEAPTAPPPSHEIPKSTTTVDVAAEAIAAEGSGWQTFKSWIREKMAKLRAGLTFTEKDIHDLRNDILRALLIALCIAVFRRRAPITI